MEEFHIAIASLVAIVVLALILAGFNHPFERHSVADDILATQDDLFDSRTFFLNLLGSAFWLGYNMTDFFIKPEKMYKDSQISDREVVKLVFAFVAILFSISNVFYARLKSCFFLEKKLLRIAVVFVLIVNAIYALLYVFRIWKEPSEFHIIDIGIKLCFVAHSFSMIPIAFLSSSMPFQAKITIVLSIAVNFVFLIMRLFHSPPQEEGFMEKLYYLNRFAIGVYYAFCALITLIPKQFLLVAVNSQPEGNSNQNLNTSSSSCLKQFAERQIVRDIIGILVFATYCFISLFSPQQHESVHNE